MQFSKLELETILEAKPGEVYVATHPSKSLVLVTIVGSAVLLGLTLDQIDGLIDQLTISRDRLAHRDRSHVPHHPTPL